MRAFHLTSAALLCLAMATGCGSGDDQSISGGGGPMAPAASREAPRGCGSSVFAAHRIESFERALAAADGPALGELLGGRFEWFSVNGWPHGGEDAFVAYSPAKTISFVERDHGIGADLRELAVSLPGERNYVDVSYSGYVREPQRPADGKRDVLIGKGALNCDGTVRVWSMAVKASKAEAFTACSGRNGQRIGGLVVCRMR